MNKTQLKKNKISLLHILLRINESLTIDKNLPRNFEECWCNREQKQNKKNNGEV